MSASGTAGSSENQFWLHQEKKLHSSDQDRVGVGGLISQALDARHAVGESRDEEKCVSCTLKSRNQFT